MTLPSTIFCHFPEFIVTVRLVWSSPSTPYAARQERLVGVARSRGARCLHRGHGFADGWSGLGIQRSRYHRSLCVLLEALALREQWAHDSLSMSYLKEERIHLAEYYGFLLLSLVGMMVMVSAADLLTIYLGLELMSLALYVLAGFKRVESRSLEASAKYFVLGSFSSGILLYGISLLYRPDRQHRFISHCRGHSSTLGLDDPAMLLAMVLLVVGFGFKISVVPFHMWTPDVYEGSPTSVTAFMAVASKVASFAAFMRVFLEGLGGLKAHWEGLFLALCVATLVLGNVVAIVQTNIKRMFAYSSIAHAGYALIGVVVAGHADADRACGRWACRASCCISVYAFMTLGAFAVVAMVRKQGVEGDEIEDFAGLSKRHPVAALLMLVFMVSLAGIPPTAGFIGKFYLFMAAIKAGLTWLAIVAVVLTAISAYFYLRVVMVMYMREPQSVGPATRFSTSPAIAVVLACALAGVVLLGLFPNVLVSLSSQSVFS